MPFELKSSHVELLLSVQRRLDLLIPAMLDIVLDLTRAERGFLLLQNREGELVIEAGRNKEKEDLPLEQFQGSTTIVRRVMEEKTPLFIPLLPGNQEFSQVPSVRAGSLQSVICIPLVLHASPEFSGALYVDSSAPVAAELMTSKDLQMIQDLAHHVAISIENAWLFEELEERNKLIDALNRQLQQKVQAQKNRLDHMQILFEDTQRELGKKYGLGSVIGKSPAMQKVFRVLDKVMETSATVLLQGESGTGKELIARHIHYHGPRSSQPMISVNCGAFNDELLESELFGHRKGAFTGADQNKTGVFQLADNGTLFLDEVADMSPEMQKKLLRVLQNGEVRPVGSKDVVHVDVRVIAASNRILRDLVSEGKFREDLYYRLNVIRIDLPPLRERLEDFPVLIEFMIRKISEEIGHPPVTISEPLLAQLLEYEWPGNVRELENELRRILILDSEYRFEPSSQRRAVPKETLDLGGLEKDAILRAMDLSSGNKTRAAELLGIPLRTLYEKLKRYGV